MNTNTTANASTHAQVANTSTHAQVVLSLSESPHKPIRQEYLKTMVLDGSGNPVNEVTWKEVVKNLEDREAKKMIKKQGWQVVNVFMRDQFRIAKQAYRESMKTSRIKLRETLINEAFDKAEREHEPHIERALKTMLPLFKNVPPSRTLIALRNIIRVTSNVSGAVKSTTH
jgi:hypothetical protein